jgi:glycosyltransferase involved in cell wall biosynthesis
MRVAVFTDNDFDKVNGVTTTLRAVLQHAPPGVQPRIYTASDLAIDAPEYFALKSIGVGIPFYREMRMYAPRLRMFARQAVADGVSVVHVTTPGPIGLAGRYVAARLGLPLVGSFHTHLAEYATMLSGSSTLGRVTRAYMNWLYRPSRQLLVPSESTRTMLASGGFDRSRLHLWTRGVDTRTFAPSRRSATLRERWGVSDRRPALLYVGRLSREKGLALFDDLQTALIRYHVSHRFVFVGDGPMREELKALCPDAIFTGTLPHSEVADAMASADVFVFPSTTDSAGNVVLEAQACGLPVIVANEGGPSENMLPGRTGFVCEANDALGFCWRIADLVRDPSVKTEMGRAAREYTLTRSWSEALAALYHAWEEAAIEAERSRLSPSAADRHTSLAAGHRGSR